METEQASSKQVINEKVVEKHYIEVNPSGLRKFLHGLLGGLGWGVGITVGTAVIIVGLGYLVSKIDFVPFIGDYLNQVIERSIRESTPQAR
ncbi:hypothetical protein HY382_02400 [Candidatus Curtissbacteria bacterium]|nr:hypothetical protein [Candidatus Curtissbacteria bacterium]